ncbi:MAG: hypothetical protein EAZ95_16280 [Bacteroidetes bacterium]|nr:MAG: hypothetical protein EAZ95_16280 [Bacteroidota bacterium]
MLGFTQQEGAFCAVVSQPYIDFNTATDLDAVKAFLSANGFEHKRNNDYFHPKLGIILEDLHDENVLMCEGVLFVVDSVFYLTNDFWFRT